MTNDQLVAIAMVALTTGVMIYKATAAIWSRRASIKANTQESRDRAKEALLSWIFWMFISATIIAATIVFGS